MKKIKHFVKYYSPGSFVAENTEFEIDKWDIEMAMEMAHTIRERHNARPYGFMFYTKELDENDFEPKMTSMSGMYYLGGKVYTLIELKKLNDPKNSILISNMETNGWKKIVQTYPNTFSWSQPLNDTTDVVLEFSYRD